MKKYYKIFPWIPIVGIPLTLLSDVETTGLVEPSTFSLSALLQGISMGLAVFVCFICFA